MNTATLYANVTAYRNLSATRTYTHGDRLGIIAATRVQFEPGDLAAQETEIVHAMLALMKDADSGGEWAQELKDNLWDPKAGEPLHPGDVIGIALFKDETGAADLHLYQVLEDGLERA